VESTEFPRPASQERPASLRQAFPLQACQTRQPAQQVASLAQQVEQPARWVVLLERLRALTGFAAQPVS
jgi:hypothetical protein